jgi:uncharacterized repeat protein (TIGR04138 family)
MQSVNFEEVLDQIVARDPRYTREAYFFLREALDHTQKLGGRLKPGELNHVTGQQLLDGIRAYALDQFGPMAKTVLNAWGITKCGDFGEIVFNMVETNVLAKTDSDRREDFQAGYTFEDAFLKPFRPARRSITPTPAAESSPLTP